MSAGRLARELRWSPGGLRARLADLGERGLAEDAGGRRHDDGIADRWRLAAGSTSRGADRGALAAVLDAADGPLRRRPASRHGP